jgi:hypothetical protein
MKTNRLLPLLILMVGLIIPSSCYTEVPEEYVGTWETELTLVEIPLIKEDGSEDIYTDSVVMGLQIFANKVASGYIGLAGFEDVPVKKNPGDAESKGIAYIVKCGDLGKLFPHDPLEKKEIEINLSPIHGGTMGSEINYISKWLEMFPYMIADPVFYRVE